jgi:hypothetical protein
MHAEAASRVDTNLASSQCPLWVRIVRFTPESGHRNSVVECPLCAKSGQASREMSQQSGDAEFDGMQHSRGIALFWTSLVPFACNWLLLEQKGVTRHCPVKFGVSVYDEPDGRVSCEGTTLPSDGGPGHQPYRQGNVASACRRLVADGSFQGAISNHGAGSRNVRLMSAIPPKADIDSCE